MAQNLALAEQNLLTQIFRFFTQADVEVNNCYMKHYSQVFKPTEIQMMLSAFSNMETVHIAAYSHLLDTLGMPEIEYQAFLKYTAMKDKYDYMQQWGVSSREDIAKTLAVFGGFTEGLQLFASFAIPMNFPRFNKMKGMGQIVTWSVRDESLHTNSIIRLFKTFISENEDIWTDDLQRELYVAASTIVDHEDAFIDLAFEMGGVEGLEAADVSSTSATLLTGGSASSVSTQSTISTTIRYRGWTKCSTAWSIRISLKTAPPNIPAPPRAAAGEKRSNNPSSSRGSSPPGLSPPVEDGRGFFL